MQSLAALCIVGLMLSVSSQVNYVKPNDTIQDCSNLLECRTLEEYTQEMASYFTTGSTFVFLAGNHSLQTTLNLTNIFNMTLRGEENGSYIKIASRIKFAILCKNSIEINVNRLTFVADDEYYTLTVLVYLNCIQVSISYSIFQGRGETPRGLETRNSTITIVKCVFSQLYYQVYGGAIYASKSSITIIGSMFFRNRVQNAGGAIYAYKSSVNVIGINSFHHNTAESSGGAIECKHCTLTVTGCNYFSNNSARDKYSLGGAIRVIDGALIITNTTCTEFSSNEAVEGGAIFLYSSSGSFTGVTIFKENSAQIGGAITVFRSSLLTESKVSFIRNKGYRKGGAISISIHNNRFLVSGDNKVHVSGLFLNNQAQNGGAIFAEKKRESLTFSNITSIGNTLSALWITDCTITLTGYVNLVNNSGISGGGVFARNSLLFFTDIAVFDNNKAVFGGALYSLHGSLSFSGNTTFTHNFASKDGGALYAVGTRISIKDIVNIMFSSARNGGAIYLESGSFLILKKKTNLTTSHNYAYEFGGVIYHQEIAIPIQCQYVNSSQFQQLPYCFLQFSISKFSFVVPGIIPKYISVHSCNDSAGKDGNFLFGGLLDRCLLEFQNRDVKEFMAYNFVKNINFKMVTKNRTTAVAVASKPYALCFCDENEAYAIDKRSCSQKSMSIYTSQTFTVFVIALSQGTSPTPSKITAILNPTARMELNQSVQTLHKTCTRISYTVYSSDTFEQIILYPEGPCYDNGLARATVNLTIKPCPKPLILSGEECVCGNRLQRYGAICKLGEKHAIIETGLKFWLTAFYDNKTYQGLILNNHCPAEYCKTESMNVTLDNPDIQCANSRSGMLCGACATNYSLMLGSSRCEECSNAYLALLLPFAAAGVALVVFLSILRLTVATGMINSVIFYANIVQANRTLFFPTNAVNVLTVFIAWLNLDLGLETCFYNGLNSYAKTWLQFAFPIYVWILVVLIILVCRRSITASKLIGHNPVAVLATLILMSYNKTLKIIMDVYSFANLDYPDSKIIKMWLKDANIHYLQSWHLLLTVVTSLFLVLLFLPYTLLLLLGYKLYYFSFMKYFRWLNRIKPLLDSYYAPFKEHTRYWTGFLLLVRCILYIIIPLTAMNEALVLALTAMVIKAWLFGRIYNKLHLDIIESSIYLNLIVLSTLTTAECCPTALTYSLVSIVFVTMLGIIVFQLLNLYVIKIVRKLWITLRNTLSQFKTSHNDTLSTISDTSGSTAYKVSTTFVELREPLLDN